MEVAIVIKHRLGRLGGLAILPMAMVVAGCGPEGAGTVDVSSPTEVRAKQEGESSTGKPVSAKQAKAKEAEAEAAKKNPKLH